VLALDIEQFSLEVEAIRAADYETAALIQRMTASGQEVVATYPLR
jgi:hypothetical protein